MTATIDILIPTYSRPTALAVTLTSLCAQTYYNSRIIISDQTEDSNPLDAPEVQTPIRLLRARGHQVDLHKHLPRRGMAEQRQFLLEQATAPYVLYIDDDLILEPWVVYTLLKILLLEGCGFVGSAVIGLSFVADTRPQQQQVEFWHGPVRPELVKPGTPQWERYKLHNAANLYHVQQRLNLTPENVQKYKVAWVSGCIMYHTLKLRSVGGFNFWHELPSNHCGEDVLAQLRVMERYGGCGIMPSGVYHQELPTTIHDRTIDAPQVLFSPSESLAFIRNE